MNKVLFVHSAETLEDIDIEFLKRGDIEMVPTRDVSKAIEMIKHEAVSVLVTELHLEGETTGDELCRISKLKHKELPVVIICSDKVQELKLCTRCGADAQVSTPLDMDVLARKLASILNIPARRATRVLTRAQVQGSARKEAFYGVSQNISISGMMLVTEHALAKDDIVNCSVFLPERDRLSVDCRVVRIEKGEGKSNRYGMEFKEISSENKMALVEFIKAEREAGNAY